MRDHLQSLYFFLFSLLLVFINNTLFLSFSSFLLMLSILSFLFACVCYLNYVFPFNTKKIIYKSLFHNLYFLYISLKILYKHNLNIKVVNEKNLSKILINVFVNFSECFKLFIQPNKYFLILFY
jgi:hypothetical protein